MKHLLFMLVLALAPLPSYAAEPGCITIPAFGPTEQAKSQPITLVGPATLNVGEMGVYHLTGTPTVDISKPLLDQLGWAIGVDRMYLYSQSPGSLKLPLIVELKLVIGADGVTCVPVIGFTPRVAGEHRLLTDWHFGQHCLAEILIVVGGDGPEPDPDPIPPPPGPLAEMWLIVVEDRQQRTPEQAWVLLDPTVREWMEANGHHFRILDRTKKTSDLMEWISRATAQTEHALPYLFVVDDSGVVFFEGPLPIGPIQMLELVEKWGAEK